MLLLFLYVLLYFSKLNSIQLILFHNLKLGIVEDFLLASNDLQECNGGSGINSFNYLELASKWSGDV